MNKFKLMLALLAAPSMVLASCGPEQGEVDSGITSVSVSLKKASLYEGETTQATANVKATSGVDKSVVWSSSNTAVATVDENGNVKALKKGSAKIIATSKVDNTKKGEKTLTVKEDQGFDPSWIEEGFTYSKEFPTSKIKEFLGSGNYDVIEPSEMEAGGAYYLESPESAGSAACFVVIIDGVLNKSYAYDLLDAGFERVYETSLGTIEGVDPTGTYTVSMYCNPDETTYEDAAPTFIQFYKSEDVWDSPNKTSDTAWNLERIVNVDPSEIAIATEWVGKVPFVALGEDYCIEYIVDDSEYYYYIDILMMFGFTEEEAIEYMSEEGLTKEALTYYYLSVYDYSICEPFEGYEDVLTNAGYVFVSEEDEYGDVYEYYQLSEGLFAYDLSFSFGETGNTIYLEQTAAVLDAFPKSYVDEFVSDVIVSKYEVPAYEETEGASFMAQIFEDEMDIMIDSVEISEFEAYKDKLELEGFEVEYTPASELDYPGIYATKGRIVIEMQLVQEEGDEDYLDYGPVYMYIYGDDSKHEEKGIYLPETTNAVLKAGSIELDPEMVDLDDANLTWTSSDEDIATVSDGVVTMLAVGEVNITVTTDVETSEPGVYYSATTKLVVTEKPDFAPVLAGLNEALALYGGTEVLTANNIPEIDCVEYYGFDGFPYCECYVIQGYEPEETNESYTSKLEGLGFEVLEDEDGKYYETEEYKISFNLWPEDEEGPACFQICVYFQEEESVGATFDFTEGGYEVSGGDGVFAYAAAKGGNTSSPPATHSDSTDFKELRLYDKNTLTISSEEEITSIEIICNDCSCSKSGAELTCSTGKLEETDDGYLWTGSANSVTFTCVRVGSGDAGKQCHIQTIVINGDGEGGGGGGGGGEVTADPEEVASEIAYNVFGDEEKYYKIQEGVFYVGVYWDDEGAMSLAEAVEDAWNYTPEEFIYCSEIEEGTDDSGAYASMTTTNEDESVFIEIDSYVEDGYICIDFYIYSE